MNNFEVDWHAHCQHHLDDFIQTGTMVLDGLFGQNEVAALQQESGFVQYQEACLTHGERHSAIRGDSIRWIDESCPMGVGYLGAINEFGRYLNQTLFAGIRRSEAHYACYPSGFGYDWHTDNPKGRSERVISAVFYLNEQWTAEDGGAIVVVDKQEQHRQLLPKLNRLVVFDSNLLHKVQVTHRNRFSIATWLRSDDGVIW